MISQPKQAIPYYGAKSKIISHYPEPKYDVIVEPFAGSAAYSQRYWDRHVILIDLFPAIVSCWDFLIAATKQDILDLPDVTRETRVKELNLPIGARNLIGFHINRASTAPRNVPTVRCLESWNRGKSKLAEIVHHFDNWIILDGGYDDLTNDECTWFIDPPYQFGGEHYVKSSTDLDFQSLGNFCKTRQGQTIVCENIKATWMPFTKLINIVGMRQKTTESIWTNET